MGLNSAEYRTSDDADTFPEETTVTLESLPTYTEEVSFGRHGVTSDLLTTYTVQLDQYEAVRFEMETDYYAWMTIIDPDVGVLYRSGHGASGSTSAAHTIVAEEAGPIHVRLSVNSGITANGTSILTVWRVQTELITLGETMGFPPGGSNGLVAVDLEAGQTYRIELTTENDGFVRLFDTTYSSRSALPLTEMYNIQGTTRIWTQETSGRVFFRVSAGEDTRLVRLTISEVNE